MSFLERLIGQRAASFENPSTSLANPAAWLVHFFGGDSVMAGVHVNERSAVGVPAIYACVRIIAETIAALPLGVYERLDDGSRRLATDHPLFGLLHNSPNEFQTSFIWRETGTAHQCLWGNGYSFLDVDPRSLRVQGLFGLMPDQVTPKRVGARLVYEYQGPDGRKAIIEPSNILHWPALGFDGVVGLSPIRLMRESIGLSMATERFGARFFGAGAHPSGILTHPGKFSSEAVRDRVLDSWRGAHGGLDKSHKTAILEEGMDFKPITIPPEDAQFLETRELQVKEAARMYRIPLHMLADLSQAPAANVEQSAIDFVVYTITPWLVRQEQEMNHKLLREDERGRFYVQYNVKGLLRGDSVARADYYAKRFALGSLSPNDIRRLEDENPIEGGDRYFVPLNFVPLDQAGELQAAKANPQRSTRALPALEVRQARSVQMRQRLINTHRRLFLQAAQTVVLREFERVGRQARKLLSDGQRREFDAWLETFYEEFQPFVARQFLPALNTFGELVQAEALEEIGSELGETHDLESFLAGYAARMARGYAASSRNQLRELTEQAEAPADAVQQRLEEWREGRPDKVADQQVVEASSAVAKAAYAAAGVQLIRWVTVGDNCPLCRRMSGKVVGVSETFLAAGESIEAEGAEPYTARRMVTHPPLHQGCDCTIVAGG